MENQTKKKLSVFFLIMDWCMDWMESFAESNPKEQMGMMADAALVTSPFFLALLFKEALDKTAVYSVLATLFFFVLVCFLYGTKKMKEAQNTVEGDGEEEKEQDLEVKGTVTKWFKAFPYILLIYIILLLFITN